MFPDGHVHKSHNASVLCLKHSSSPSGCLAEKKTAVTVTSNESAPVGLMCEVCISVSMNIDEYELFSKMPFIICSANCLNW